MNQALLAAQLAESCVRQQLEAARAGTQQHAAHLIRLCDDMGEAVKAAKLRVETVLWE